MPGFEEGALEFVRIVQSGRVERWTLARPERLNALGTTLAAELSQKGSELRDRAARDAAPHVVVIGADPVERNRARTWVAGGDLKELASIDGTDGARRYAAMMAGFLELLDELPVLIVLAVDGAAIGGGAELALAGDLRVATAASSLAFKQLRVGLATGYGGARRLVNMVGISRAQGLLFLGETLSAEKALELGLFHRVVADSAALDLEITRLAADLSALGKASIAAQKAMFRLAVRAHPGAAQQGELEIFARLWGNPEHARFLARFSEEKRS